MRSTIVALVLGLALIGCGGKGGGGGGDGPVDLSDPKSLAALNCEVMNLAGEDPTKLAEIYKRAGLGDDMGSAARSLTEAIAKVTGDPAKAEAYRDAYLGCLK